LAAKEAPNSFPTDEIRPARIRKIIETMRMTSRAESTRDTYQELE
jgi:hypothetical protein